MNAFENADALDTFFAPMSDSSMSMNIMDSDTLADAYTLQTMSKYADVSDLLSKHMKMREEVLIHGEDACADPDSHNTEEIQGTLMKWKEEFRQSVLHYNNLKDKLDKEINNKNYVTNVRRDTSRLYKQLYEMLPSYYDDDTDDASANDSNGVASSSGCTSGDTPSTLHDMSTKYNQITNDTDIYCYTLLLEIEKKIESLRGELKKSKQKIKTYMDVFSFTNGFSMGHPCPICLTSEVKLFCEPCGHTYCNNCMKSAHCYICRTKITKTHKLFFT